MLQMMFGLVGAFIGSIGATIMRASNLGLKQLYHVEEL
jgi:hypothetical protein